MMAISRLQPSWSSRTHWRWGKALFGNWSVCHCLTNGPALGLSGNKGSLWRSIDIAFVFFWDGGEEKEKAGTGVRVPCYSFRNAWPIGSPWCLIGPWVPLGTRHDSHTTGSSTHVMSEATEKGLRNWILCRHASSLCACLAAGHRSCILTNWRFVATCVEQACHPIFLQFK